MGEPAADGGIVPHLHAHTEAAAVTAKEGDKQGMGIKWTPLPAGDKMRVEGLVSKGWEWCLRACA